MGFFETYYKNILKISQFRASLAEAQMYERWNIIQAFFSKEKGAELSKMGEKSENFFGVGLFEPINFFTTLFLIKNFII